MFGKREEKEIRLSDESAKNQLQIFLDYYELDDLSDEDLKMLQPYYDKLKKAIMKGRVEISIKDDGDLNIKQITKISKDEFNYGVIGVSEKSIMDKYGSDKSYDRLCALMGALSGEGYEVIKKLSSVDMSTMEAIAIYLMKV